MKRNKLVVGLVVAIIAIGVFLFMAEIFNLQPDKTTDEYYQVIAKIESGAVKTVDFSGNYKLTYTEGNKEYVIYVPSRIEFKKDIDTLKVAYETNNGAGSWAAAYNISFDNPEGASLWNILSTVLLVGIGIALFYFIYKQMSNANKQTMNFGKTRAQNAINSKVKFADVAGAEEEKEELKEIVEFLKFPKKFSALGARIPKGVLLVGPPGTGKTLFAKAVAGEANVPFFSVSGSDFVEMFVGVGASRVRDLFDQAKRSNSSCIIFIDEIDAVGRQRGAGLGGGHDEREQTLNQLLVQMDGFEENQGIIVMAATNRPDVLDPALLRAGRFDRQIYVPIPDVRGREAIFRVHTRSKPMADDINYQTLARITSGFSGAEIENLLNESAILAVRHNRDKITMADINEGISKVVMGPQKKSRLVTENDKRITAIHEAGHAVLTKLVKSGETVHEVSIIPRGMAAGYTMFRPENDEQHQSKQKLLDNIVISLGGRVAEELLIKEICTGASGDIKQVTSLAHRMVTEWGMSEEIGNLFLGGEKDVFLGRDFQAQHTYSEVMAAKIDAETKKIIDACHARATALLNKNRKILENMTMVLLDRETIYTAEVDMLLKGATVEEVLDFINENDKKQSAAKESSIPVTMARPDAIKQPQSIKPPDMPPETPADPKATPAPEVNPEAPSAPEVTPEEKPEPEEKESKPKKKPKEEDPKDKE